MVNLVVRLGADAQHAGLHLGFVVNGSVNLAGIQGGDRRHTHRDRQAAADGQSIGTRHGLLVRARRNQNGAWCFDFCGFDERIHHGRELVARLRPGGSGCDQTKTGSGCAHAGVGVGCAQGADGDIFGGIQLAQTGDAVGHRRIATAASPSACDGFDGVEGIRTATGKGQAHTGRDGDRSRCGRGVDAGRFTGHDADRVLGGIEQRAVGIGLYRAGDAVVRQGHTDRHRTAYRPERCSHRDRLHGGDDARGVAC